MIAFACAAMLCWVATKEVEALTCACSDCDAGVCTVLDAGGSCYASLVLVDMVQVAPIHRGCYDYAAASKDYCGTDTFVPLNGTNYSTYYKVECCDDKDQCNKELSPALTTGFLSTPDDSKLVCHSYNSKKSDYKSFCETDRGFCYWMLRRNESGNTTQWKQGCSSTCEPDNRNRVTKHCCKTSHCNVFPGDEPTGSPVVTTASSSSFPLQTSPSPQVSPLSLTSLSSVGDPTSLPTSAATSLEMSPYLIVSAILGALYLLIVVVLIVLVAGVCIRQRNLSQSLHDKTSLYSRSTSSTSV